MDMGPRLFRPGTLYSSKTYEQIFSATYRSPDILEHSEDEVEDEVDDVMTFDEQQQDLQEILCQAREDKMQALSQQAVTTKPVDDEFAELIINELDLRAASANSIRNMDVDDDDDAAATDEPDPASPVISPQYSYPPVNQTGPILDHDRPFAEYGHLDRETIVQEFKFNLQPFPTQPPPDRYHAKSFAIISATNLPKEDVKARILAKFPNNKILYICIGEYISEFSQQPQLHIQIIFKDKIDRRKPFLDEIMGTNCNYQVTRNDLAWNEYIKKGGHFTEFGQFKSIQKLSQKQWPPSSISSTTRPPPITTTAAAVALPSKTLPQQQPLVLPRITTTTARPTTVRARAEEKRIRDDDIARQALLLADKSVDEAMDFIREVMPIKYMQHPQWYDKRKQHIYSFITLILFVCLAFQVRRSIQIC
jgi:hypothetical protein